MDASRYLRQLLLAEVGAAGQARIGAARARVGGATPAHAVAELYARRAGFAGVDPAAPGALELEADDAAGVCTPAARALLAGARLALRETRRALDQAEAEGEGRR
ncbi:MAG: hypothetical protein WKG00_41285 [Polyangiaceae bacterium]